MRTSPTDLITPVRPMTKVAIQQEALAILARLYPEALETPCAVPILRFLEEDMEFEYGLRLVVLESMWPREGGARPQEHPDGAGISFSQDRFDLLCRDNVSARFLGAHEFGHAMLHLDQLQVERQDGVPRFAGLKLRSQVKPYMDPEWQADTFASHLLLPEPMLRLVVNDLGWSESRIAGVFKVPRVTIEIRLSPPRAA